VRALYQGEKSESRIEESERRRDLRREQKMEREERAAVTCNGRLFQRRATATGNAWSATVDRRVHRTSRDVDEAERNRRLASVSAGRRSSSYRYEDA